MVGGTDFTDAHAALLKEYYLRRENKFPGKDRMLGPIKGMEEKIAELEARKEAGFQFGATSLSFIKGQWLRDRYGYKKPVVTLEMLKGQMCEQDTMGLTQSVLGGPQFRTKCKVAKEDEYHLGHCDIDLKKEDCIEDIKTSWDLSTFFAVEDYPELYYAQGQVYMRLYKRGKFRLIYGLVSTPDELIEQELNKFRYKFGGDYDNKHYKEIEEQVYHNHKVDHIPKEDRIKIFEFERNDEYIRELERRVVLAQEIYNGLSLSWPKKVIAKAA